MPSSSSLVRDSLQWRKLMHWLLVNKNLQAFVVKNGSIECNEQYFKVALQYAKNMSSPPSNSVVSDAILDLQMYSAIFLDQWKSICSKVHDDDIQLLLSTLDAPKIKTVLQTWKTVFALWKDIYFDDNHIYHNVIKNQVSLILFNTGKKISRQYLNIAPISCEEINACLTSLGATYRSNVRELCDSVIFGKDIKRIPFEIGDENLLNTYQNKKDTYEVICDKKMANNLKAKHEALTRLTNDQSDENYSEIKMLLNEVAEALPDLNCSKPENLLKRTSPFTESKKITPGENPLKKLRRKLHYSDSSEIVDISYNGNLEPEEPSICSTVKINSEVPIPNGGVHTVEEQSDQEKAKVTGLKNLKKLQVEIMKSGKLDCLIQNKFLNDLIIEFSFNHIYLYKLSDKNREKSYFFNTFFYTRLAIDENSNRTNGAIVGEKKSINLFDKDFLVFPINYNFHWFLVITCFLNKLTQNFQESNDESKSPFILVLDSCKSHLKNNRDFILMDIIHYLGNVYYKANNETLVELFTLRPITADVPQQNNGVDCGIYMIEFLQLFYESHVTNEDSFKEILKHWHDKLSCSNRRKEISEMIKNYQ